MYVWDYGYHANPALPEVKKAVAEGRPVWLVEGENGSASRSSGSSTGTPTS